MTKEPEKQEAMVMEESVAALRENIKNIIEPHMRNGVGGMGDLYRTFSCGRFTVAELKQLKKIISKNIAKMVEENAKKMAVKKASYY